MSLWSSLILALSFLLFIFLLENLVLAIYVYRDQRFIRMALNNRFNIGHRDMIGPIGKVIRKIPAEVLDNAKMIAKLDREGRLVPSEKYEAKTLSELKNILGELRRVSDIPRNAPELPVYLITDENAGAYADWAIGVGLPLIEGCENIAEVAGILAHEVAHHALRHTLRNSCLLLRFPLAFISKRILFGSQLPGQLDIYGYMAERMEYEADTLAVQYLWSAGYDPTYFAEFLARHRLGLDRIQVVLSEIRTLHKLGVPRP